MSDAIPEVDVHHAAAKAADGLVLLLDVREDGEWEEGHAADATHLPMSRLDPLSVPTDRPIVAVCRSGNRSGQVTKVLLGLGVDVTNMTGGMNTWAAAGLPVVRSDGSTGAVG